MRLDERTALRAYRRETKEYVFLLGGDAATIFSRLSLRLVSLPNHISRLSSKIIPNH